MNRHERRAARALAKRAGVTHESAPLTRETALAAIMHAVSPRVRAERESQAASASVGLTDAVHQLADAVVDGVCTVAQAAEALTVTHDLAVASASGEITRAMGSELIHKMTARHLGKVDAD